MKKTLLIKAVAAVLVLIGCVMAVPVNAEKVRTVNVQGTNGRTLEFFDANTIDFIEFGDHEAPYAYFAPSNRDVIVFCLAPGAYFRMVKVEGGTYTLQSPELTWTEAQKTKTLSDYYIAEFECTQAVWKAVNGSLPTGQSAFVDDYPVTWVSWSDIAGSGSNTFLKQLNAKMPQIKANSAADVVVALGNMQFSLPNEWEWEYAAAGGKDWAKLKYYFAGATANNTSALNAVAVNNVSPNRASSVAVVGSKLPNNLGLYDMSGNVSEWCSGLGYPGHETTPGYLSNSGFWTDNYALRGGGYVDNMLDYFYVSSRFNNTWGGNHHRGFRLVLH